MMAANMYLESWRRRSTRPERTRHKKSELPGLWRSTILKSTADDLNLVSLYIQQTLGIVPIVHTR